jgi:hypothetical protein
MLLDRKKVGVVLRTFAKTPDQVAAQVTQITETVDRLGTLLVQNHPAFSRIDVMVAADEHYVDCDCGQTAEALRSALSGRKNVFVSEVKHGDLFCGLLNYGVALQNRAGIDFTAIISTAVREYITPENIAAMIEALSSGAKVTGLALAELTDSILEGQIANTFAIWDNVALLTVGGFDLKATNALRNDRLTTYLRGWNEAQEKQTGSGDVYYPTAGVEEIIPLVRLVGLHGQCIAPLRPCGAARWQAPDPIMDPDGYVRHLKKMGTKLPRQMAFASTVGADLTFIQGGVMKQYRQS